LSFLFLLRGTRLFRIRTDRYELRRESVELDELNWLYNLIQLTPDLLDSSPELTSTTKAIPGLKDHRQVDPNTTEEEQTIPDRYWPVGVEARIG
jgi:hypothetical protein